MIRLDAAPRTVGHVAIDRQHNTRTVQLFGNLRRGNADHASMPTFARDDSHERILGSVVKFFYRQIDDLLLNSLAFLVSRVEVFSEMPRNGRIACIKELDYGFRRVHAAGSVNPRSEPETEIVCCHALAVSATGHINECL